MNWIESNDNEIRRIPMAVWKKVEQINYYLNLQMSTAT